MIAEVQVAGFRCHTLWQAGHRPSCSTTSLLNWLPFRIILVSFCNMHCHEYLQRHSPRVHYVQFVNTLGWSCPSQFLMQEIARLMRGKAITQKTGHSREKVASKIKRLEISNFLFESDNEAIILGSISSFQCMCSNDKLSNTSIILTNIHSLLDLQISYPASITF